MQPLHILLAVCVMAAWGVNFVIIKLGLNDFPPILLSALRFGFAGLPILLIWRRPPASIKWIAAIALALGLLKFNLLFIGMKLGAAPGLSSLILQSQAFFTVILAFFLLGERPTGRQVTGMGLAFGGLAVIMAEATQGNGSSSLIGIVIVISAAVFWGFSNISMKKAQSNNPLALIIWVSAFAAPFLFAISYLFEDWSTVKLTPIGAFSVFYLAVIATLAGFAIWAYLLRTYHASKVAPFSLLVPLFGLSSSAWYLNEPLTLYVLGAALLILSGLYLSVIPKKVPKPC